MDIELTHPGELAGPLASRRPAPARAAVLARRRPRVQRDREVPFGISTAIGSGAMLLVLLSCAVVPGRDGAVRMALIGAVLAWFAASSGDLAAVAAVLVVTCLVGDGFLVNHEGLLSWHGWPDVWRVAVLAAAAGIGLAVGRARVWLGERRRFAVVRMWS